jgi:hypothetical protein
VETQLGITRPDGAKWVRAKPRTIREAAVELGQDGGRSAEAFAAVLKDRLLLAATPEESRLGQTGARGGPFFAFKLHQFISGAGVAYTTLDRPGERTVELEGQQYLPGDPDRRLYPLGAGVREVGTEAGTPVLLALQPRQGSHYLVGPSGR